MQEHRLFETVFGEEAISTMKILALASDLGIGVCKITGNIAGECPGMNQSSDVMVYVHEALVAGYDVIIPKAPLYHFHWSGTAWIAIDPATGSASYLIYGGLSVHDHADRLERSGRYVQVHDLQDGHGRVRSLLHGDSVD